MYTICSTFSGLLQLLTIVFYIIAVFLSSASVAILISNIILLKTTIGLLIKYVSILPPLLYNIGHY